jgi:hypothetical protein
VAVVKAELTGDKEEEHDDFDGDRTVRHEGIEYWYLYY